jgi:predicted negative regulator of RcsB-dependent stress response
VKRRLIPTLLLVLWTLVAFAPAYAHTNNASHSQKQANNAAKKYSKQQEKAQKKQIKQQKKDAKKWNKQHPRVTTT